MPLPVQHHSYRRPNAVEYHVTTDNLSELEAAFDDDAVNADF
jgi:hypothetical protein